MKIEQQFLGITVAFLFSFNIFGQSPSDVYLVNTGKMALRSNGSTVSMYIAGAARMSGGKVDVLQNGIIDIKGNFYNDITMGNVFNELSNGTCRFAGTTEQQITGVANRAINYIDFPSVEINNPNAVSLASNMGMDADFLDLKKGPLILRSSVISNVETQLAHLRIKAGNNMVVYKHTPVDKGVIEVEFALSSPEGEYTDGRFFGFSSPFKTMYADYFMFNILMAPNAQRYAGSGPLTNPLYALVPGKGYFVGHDIFPHSTEAEIRNHYSPLEDYQGALFDDRMQSLLRLNRINFNNSLSFANTKPDAYTGEQIQTEDVSVNLEKGFNYLGNPFTTPLRMNTLFENVIEASSDPWGVSRNHDQNDDDGMDVFTAIWVPNSGIGVHKPGTMHTFTFTTSFLVGQKVGSTLSLIGNDGEIQIEPMQMFAVWAKKPGNIRIPVSERTHGNLNILRSNESYETDDELLIEVRDRDTDAFDRTCIVFRPEGNPDSKDAYDAFKLFNQSRGVSQIHTHSSDEEALSINVINADTQSIPLTLVPCLEPKQVELSAHRMETLHSPQVVLLEDTQNGHIVDLQKEGSYQFETHPNDIYQRFILHFVSMETGIEENGLKNIRVYYSEDNLILSGLKSTDTASQLSVYDMEGRMLQATIIPASTYGTYRISSPELRGVYLVKLSGNYAMTTRVICK